MNDKHKKSWHLEHLLSDDMAIYRKEIEAKCVEELEDLYKRNPIEYARRKTQLIKSSRFYEEPKTEEKPYEYDPDYDDI